jgi:hypothetical protein
LGELTFEVGRISALSVPRGRSAPHVFVLCSSSSCSPFVSIRHGFEFWLDEVSDGPRVLGGRSACVGRTVRGCLADSPRAPRGRSVVRGVPLEVLFALTVGPRLRPDSPRKGCGQSVVPCRMVHPSWPDGLPEPVSFASWFDSSLPFSCFRVCFTESFLRLEVDP